METPPAEVCTDCQGSALINNNTQRCPNCAGTGIEPVKVDVTPEVQEVAPTPEVVPEPEEKIQ